MLFRRLIFAALILHVPYRTDISAQVPQSLRIMFYNVENAFDIYDDKNIEDEEYLPGGTRRWNYSRYNKKINDIYKTIVSSRQWNPPEIVAFCEIENRQVLEDLIFGTYLSKFKYSIVHADSPDRRGIDVCLIYRSDIIGIPEFRYWIPKTPGVQYTSRSILYSKVITNSDTIHLIVNHWPSRRGGVLAGEETRLIIARMIIEKSDSINNIHKGKAKILIMGDFNSTPEDHAIKEMTQSGLLVNLSENILHEHPGSYRYQGTWEMIDQVIASEYLINSEKGYYTDDRSVMVYTPDFLLIKDPSYPGQMPFSTYRGYRYQGGISDHLPILTDLFLRSPVQKE